MNIGYILKKLSWYINLGENFSILSKWTKKFPKPNLTVLKPNSIINRITEQFESQMKIDYHS